MMKCDATKNNATRRKRMRAGRGFSGVMLALSLTVAGIVPAMGPMALAQAVNGSSTDKNDTAPKQENANPKTDTRPFETIYLKNATQQNDANEITVAIRNMVAPSVKIFLVPNQNAITIRGTEEDIALAKKIVSDLDRPKKTYRLTYTITDLDGSKRVGTQHFVMIVSEGQRTMLKQGSKVPIATGSYKPGGTSDTQTQFTYLDVGMSFDATLDETASGAKLRSKVEQSSIADGNSGVGPQDPIVRQTVMEGTAYLTLGKPQVLGSLDIPGSTRRLDVEVVLEQVAQ
jgi:type II secretory pathway component GspD/PulD (secretin)